MPYKSPHKCAAALHRLHHSSPLLFPTMKRRSEVAFRRISRWCGRWRTWVVRGQRAVTEVITAGGRTCAALGRLLVAVALMRRGFLDGFIGPG
ncbi:hypothetical protein E1A91_D13G148700v1 [Gossypium mustelinum]|uniref:Uncharacterized protein n=1 Tax=Gossypium mustelinum TaxID=34275 RepID=A0A5D2S2B4_GOSMU|nr:hypothetical protein E1A91_D13G148700v1 [Gossypium mustelinum]